MSTRGSLEVVCGCMYSGKTEELIRRVKRALIGGLRVQVFKSHRDTRYSATSMGLVTHYGADFTARIVEESLTRNLLAKIDEDTQVVAIDEAQFFDMRLANACEHLAKEKGLRVIVAGLDLNFRGEPFQGPMPRLMAKATKLDKLAAVCVVCGEDATRSQRSIDGKPAAWSDETNLIAAEDVYTAVCLAHHVVLR